MNINCSKNSLIYNISKFILIIVCTLLIIYFIVYSIYYLTVPCDTPKKFDLNLSNICKNPEKQLEQPSQSFIQRELEREKEVFHLNNQNLTYDQAIEKCKAYNSKLATKAQIIESYNKGAHWCTYGWSDGVRAFYPVQKCLGNDCEKCGEPGINGGYFGQKNLKFGANCYGIKPPNTNIVPNSVLCKISEKGFCELEDNKEACSKSKFDKISPFNTLRWSMY